MSTKISNRASLSYSYGCKVGSALSNVATTTLQGPLTLKKTALCPCYLGDSTITYVISVTNTTGSVLTGVTVTDDLGSYCLCDCCDFYTPLELCGKPSLYVNGRFVSHPDTCFGINSVVFKLGNLGASENAMLIYNARTTDFFIPDQDAYIKNTASVCADGVSEGAFDCCEIPIGCFADLAIVKTMSPDPVTCGDQITYTFKIYNYGNLPAENVILCDSFSPAPRINGVRINSEPVSTSQYSYDSENLSLPLEDITVPAASHTRDECGRVTKVPGTVTVTVTGTLL